MPKDKTFNEEEVLQKATELFWTKGYNGTSMDELTQATGLSRSSIYDSFGNKYNFFNKSIRYYQQQQLDAVEKVVGKHNSPLKKIKALFQYAVEDILQDKQRKGCLVVNTTTELANVDKEVAALVLDNMNGMEAMFAGWIKAGQQQGEINTTFSPQAIARFLYNGYSGLRVIGQTKQDKKTLEDIVKVTLSVLDK
ncbi:MAG: TetR/AcrR family transcriptional regulator [Chitinophagaceae bacterium]